ncbi:RPL21 [Ecytonucleospora hepatopenaei]|uniref:RPL21 n=1 Tax=Ecytonucleospora hepatopenaei TaxID=646526 RepID=A0A1W0E4I7_9MICR|nr:RPL21 [Ecytonucleospora hepatopenaei]
MRSNGYRRRTRKLFSKGQKEHGAPKVTKILQQFKVGDLVDIKVDPSVVKGMPHKYYHGKTGRVYNVNRRAVGIVLYRCVGHKYIERHINARVEHLTLSRCNEDMKKRYAEYAKQREEAKANGKTCKPIKRQPKGPRQHVQFL